MRTLGRVLGVLALVIAAQGAFGQETLSWKTFTITFDRGELEGRSSTVVVTDSHGKIVLRRQGPRFLVPSMFASPGEARRQFIRRIPGGPEVLNLTEWTGGAYGAYRDLLYEYLPPRGLVPVWSRFEGRGRLGKAAQVPRALEALVRRVEWVSPDRRERGLVLLDLQTETPQLHLLTWSGGRLKDIPDWNPRQ